MKHNKSSATHRCPSNKHNRDRGASSSTCPSFPVWWQRTWDFLFHWCCVVPHPYRQLGRISPHDSDLLLSQLSDVQIQSWILVRLSSLSGCSFSRAKVNGGGMLLRLWVWLLFFVDCLITRNIPITCLSRHGDTKRSNNLSTNVQLQKKKPLWFSPQTQFFPIIYLYYSYLSHLFRALTFRFLKI